MSSGGLFTSDSSDGLLPQPEDDTFYGLPTKTKTLLKKIRRIDKLYDWQDRLMQQLLATDRNTIYCVPTSGGKTLVAELLLMRELLVNHRDAMLVLPFVAIVQEKLRALQPFAESLGFAIEEYAGSRGHIPIKKRRTMKTIFICTIEKANVVVSSLHESNRMSELGLLVIDELHMIGEDNRGATLEGLIVKIRLAASKAQSNVRILGMSATLSSFDALSKFLDADVKKDSFRPVKLMEYVKTTKIVKTKNSKVASPSIMKKTSKPNQVPTPKVLLNVSAGKLPNGTVEWEHVKVEREFSGEDLTDPEDFKTLVGEVVTSVPPKSVLIFCSSKVRCEIMAKHLYRVLPGDLLEVKKKERSNLIRAIRETNDQSAICPILMTSIMKGIAYHHSGLTLDERELIERAYLHQIISVICCTSTLAAGVNLPAERVIIRDPYVGANFISKSQYQQMIGRAGRAGLCESGESILICDPKDVASVKMLVESPAPTCSSNLIKCGRSLAFLILSLVDLKLANSMEEISDVLLNFTLSGHQYKKMAVLGALKGTIKDLAKNNLISQSNEGSFVTTSEGRGVVRGIVNVYNCKVIKEELEKALENLNVQGYLHLMYLVTVMIEENDLPREPDVDVLENSWNNLSEVEQNILPLMGITRDSIRNYQYDRQSLTPSLRRFFVSLIVYEVWKNRTDLGKISLIFRMQRGTISQIVNQAASAANSLLSFVSELGEQFWALKKLFPDICDALTYCCAPELMELMKIPGMTLPRAKQLQRAGFKTVKSIAILRNAADMSSKVELINKRQAHTIIAAARHFIKEQQDELEEKVHELAEDMTDDFDPLDLSVYEEMSQEDKMNGKSLDEEPSTKRQRLIIQDE